MLAIVGNESEHASGILARLGASETGPVALLRRRLKAGEGRRPSMDKVLNG